MSHTDTPEWSLDSIYSGFDSDSYSADIARCARRAPALLERAKSIRPNDNSVAEFLEEYNDIGDLCEEIGSFAYCRFSTDTRDERAVKELSRIEELSLPLRNALVVFRKALSELTPSGKETVMANENVASYRFFIKEQLEIAEHQMSPELEDLSADLARSGADSWSKLQEAIGSSLEAEWEPGEKKTVNELRALANSADRAVREKAYLLELEAWKSVEIPLAFSINGIKGAGTVLNRRRRYENFIDPSLLHSRISANTLNALVTTMKRSLPTFRKYFSVKASLLGVEKLRFYDLFATVGNESGGWSFADAKAFICEQFGGFSPALGDFAIKAFDESWIDARTRKGKVGGAYCIGFPKKKESRVLCNFDGSLSAVLTIAHELGHAYHHEVLKDASHIHRGYPMTLAETASIFCELIVLNAARRNADAGGRVAIAEQFLQDAAQIIVDILSRYLFETALFEVRTDGELSPQELCSLMINAQKETYGEGLDPDHLHPYMWAVKSHYYNLDLPFYNYPYAFGMLFGFALYGQYAQVGSDFVERYDGMLSETGSMSANDLTKKSGFDIESDSFWRDGIDQALSFLADLEAAVS